MNYLDLSNGDELPATFGPLRTARKKTLVRIREPNGAELIQTSWGALTATPGADWIVLNDSGGQAPIKKDIFAATYESVGDGRYRKRGIVRLVRIPVGVVARLHTLEGTLQATHPDYVVVGVHNEVYPNSAVWVAENLEFCPEADGAA